MQMFSPYPHEGFQLKGIQDLNITELLLGKISKVYSSNRTIAIRTYLSLSKGVFLEYLITDQSIIYSLFKGFIPPHKYTQSRDSFRYIVRLLL